MVCLHPGFCCSKWFWQGYFQVLIACHAAPGNSANRQILKSITDFCIAKVLWKADFRYAKIICRI
ncbi:MAG: hypothetical protein B6D35_09645 [Candidatus Brocadia sp. UTAMX2]|nr:MAG: hypothetical protein B6D35_09645 [Candidatus Brocadia sp. UTAMX2]